MTTTSNRTQHQEEHEVSNDQTTQTPASATEKLMASLNSGGQTIQEGNFRGADLRGVDLSKRIFLGGDFTHANLCNANLRGARFVGTNLEGVRVDDADLTGATLDNVNATGLRAIRSDFSSSRIEDSNFQSSTLPESVFARAYVRNTRFVFANLSNTNLEASSFIRCNLGSVRLHMATMIGAELTGSDLYMARTSGTMFTSDHGVGIYAQAGLPSGPVYMFPTSEGWELHVGCWYGSVEELEDLIAGDDGWPEAEGEECYRRRPGLQALVASLRAHQELHLEELSSIQRYWEARDRAELANTAQGAPSLR